MHYYTSACISVLVLQWLLNVKRRFDTVRCEISIVLLHLNRCYWDTYIRGRRNFDSNIYCLDNSAVFVTFLQSVNYHFGVRNPDVTLFNITFMNYRR